jgi:hypothetical protein
MRVRVSEKEPGIKRQESRYKTGEKREERREKRRGS